MQNQIYIILIIMFFVILISIQYTLNKILVLLKEIKLAIINNKNKNIIWRKFSNIHIFSFIADNITDYKNYY